MPLLTRISCLSDGAFLVELYKNRSLLKTAEVRVGRLYTVEPPNPQKRKHRGRTCIVLDFLRDKKLLRSPPVRGSRPRCSMTTRFGNVALDDPLNSFSSSRW